MIKGIVIEYFGMIGDRDYDNQTRMKQQFWRSREDYHFVEIYPLDIKELDKLLNMYLQNCDLKFRKLTDNEIWHRIKTRAVDEFSSIVSQFISHCRKLMILPQDLSTIVGKRSEPLTELQMNFLRLVWEIYSEYLSILSINNEEDFEGLLYRAIETVSLGKSRWSRKEGSDDLSSIKYLFIDEHQDFQNYFID